MGTNQDDRCRKPKDATVINLQLAIPLAPAPSQVKTYLFRVLTRSDNK